MMSPVDLPKPFAERLRAFIADPQAVVDLRRYFGIGLPPGAAAFTGSRFEHLAGGGDRPEVADRIMAEDLIAVQTLSVTVPAPVALDILEGPLGAQLSGLLHAIPRDIDMTDADISVLADGSAGGPGLATARRSARCRLGDRGEAPGP